MRRVTGGDQATILALVAEGEGYREIASKTGWSVGTIAQIVKANRNPGFALTAGQRAKLGSGVIRWAEDNAPMVLAMKQRMTDSGAWKAAGDRHRDPARVLAEQVHEDLVAQTGGTHPTMRAALYRMMGVYGAAK